MSLSGHFIHRAVANAAHQTALRFGVERSIAAKLTPVTVGLILFALRRNTAAPLGAAGLSFALNQFREDLLADKKRLGAADIRARGERVFRKVFGGRSSRAVTAIADLAEIDPRNAASILAISTAAVVSALAKTRRDLNLSNSQTAGVLISEAAMVENTDPEILQQVRDWVFEPPLVIRWLKGTATGTERRNKERPRTAPAAA
ncbi:DUF937 domain-containing protein [Hyphococcus sp.]|uniref:DUF937 domain-containing protein n=1 Tax=Hyphococcus sp. TaxID=2038636 RepID=UPI003CCC387A